MALNRRLVYSGLVLAMLPGMVLCALNCAPDPATFWSESWLRIAAPEEQQRRKELNRRQQETQQRLTLKQAVVRDLAEGRLELLEAAARLRELDRRNPEFSWELFRQQMPGSSDEERHCRQVIRLIRTLSATEAYEDRVRHFEAELQGHIDRGTLRLPDVSPGAAD
jgi:hypothetical protein